MFHSSMGRSIALVVSALLLLGTAPATARQRAPRSYPVRVTEGIVYGQGQVDAPAPGTFDLLLDLYEPVMRSKRRRPAVVLIHGGAFITGTRSQPEVIRLAQGLAAQGAVVISIDYRVVGQNPVPSPRVAPLSPAVPPNPLFTAMVAAIDDTLTALDWLRGNARRLRIDLRRLGIGGGSAGAITANHVAYVLDDFGVEAPRFRFVADLWGGILLPAGTRDAAALLERGEAPLFAVHGTADVTVPVVFDDWLVARAREVGVPVEYHRVEGGQHSFPGIGFFTAEVAPGETAFDRLLDFAATALRRGRRAR